MAGLLPLLLVVALLVPAWARAQFLRVGPFDFKGKVRVEGVYTTNVEEERESQALLDREDYYYIVALDLASMADLSPTTTLAIDTGVAYEKHFNRPDLDNEENPFGRVGVILETKTDRTTINLFAGWKREVEQEEQDYVPGGLKRRDVYEEIRYGGEVRHEIGNWKLLAGYEMTSEEHQDEDFRDADQDEETIDAEIRRQLTRRIAGYVTWEDVETTQTGLPGSPVRTEETTTVGMDWTAIERPKLRLFGELERVESDPPTGDDDWDPRAGLSVADNRDLSPTLNLAYRIEYDYEESPEDDDIGLTYEIRLTHEINEYTVQTLSATREPRSTLFSTQDTDTTEYAYLLEREDLFLQNLKLTAGVKYEVNKPVNGPNERIMYYDLKLRHDKPIGQSLTRYLEYLYSLEDSSLYPGDPIEEHRVTLGFSYDL